MNIINTSLDHNYDYDCKKFIISGSFINAKINKYLISNLRSISYLFSFLKHKNITNLNIRRKFKTFLYNFLFLFQNIIFYMKDDNSILYEKKINIKLIHYYKQDIKDHLCYQIGVVIRILYHN